MIELTASNLSARSISLSKSSSFSFCCKTNFYCSSSLRPLTNLSITKILSLEFDSFGNAVLNIAASLLANRGIDSPLSDIQTKHLHESIIYSYLIRELKMPSV